MITLTKILTCVFFAGSLAAVIATVVLRWRMRALKEGAWESDDAWGEEGDDIGDGEKQERSIARRLRRANGKLESVNRCLVAVNELSVELSGLVDRQDGCEAIYRKVKGFLGFDTGSVWLAYRDTADRPGMGYVRYLRAEALHWFDGEQDEQRKSKKIMESSVGLLGKVVASVEPVLMDKAEQIQAVSPANMQDREPRGLRAFAGVRIASAKGSVLGAIEMGSRGGHRFSEVERQFLRMVSVVAATFIRRVLEREVVMEMHAQPTEDKLSTHIETALPLVFGARAVTVYLPVMKSGRLVLTPAFSEGIQRGLGRKGRGDAWSPDYDVEEEEGLTGWVGKYKICLRLEDCTDAKEIEGLYRAGKLTDGKGVTPPSAPVWSGKTRGQAEVGEVRETYSIIICPCVGRGCVKYQEEGRANWGSQSWLVFKSALSSTSSLRMHAVRITLGALPAAARRSANARSTGL